MSTPEGAFSVFPLAAAVTAPAGALSVFHHYRSSDRSPQEHYLYFPTATAVSAPAGALSIYFLTAAAVLAPAGAFPSPGPSPAPPLFPHCRSSARSSRSIYPHILPPLPTPPRQYTSAEAAPSSKMPQHHNKRGPASHQPCNFWGVS